VLIFKTINFSQTMKASKHKKYWWNKSLLMVLFLGVFFTTSKTLHCQQNLILNPSVENLIYTPTTLGEYIDYSTFYEVRHANVLNWWIPFIDSIEHHWTTDVYSLLSDSKVDCSAPNSFAGFQQPKNGNNYLGLNLLGWNAIVNNYYEMYEDYAAGKFSESLQKDSLYEFSCYMSKADTISVFSTNAFDVVITYDTILDVTRLADFGYKIYSEQEIFRDSVNWVLVKACFKAKGGEKGFAIGNFHQSSEILKDHLPNIGDWGELDYRFFDEFSLKVCPTCCPDQFPFEEHLVVSSNPGSSSAPIALEVFAKGPTKVRVFDAMGRLVFEHAFSSNQEKIFLPLFAKGMYQYALINENGICDSGKVMMWE
jgi:hypothetical protein